MSEEETGVGANVKQASCQVKPGERPAERAATDPERLQWLLSRRWVVRLVEAVARGEELTPEQAERVSAAFGWPR